MPENIKRSLFQKIALVSILVLVFQIAIPGVFLFESEKNVMANDLCSYDVSVMMVMDNSASMSEGAVSSKCEWRELIQLPDNSYTCANKEATNVDEPFCQAKSNLPNCPFDSVFTPAFLSKIEYAKNAANSFIDNLKITDQSGLVSFNTDATLVKELSYDNLATKAAINNLTTDGATNIGDALALGISELGSSRANSKANKAMILLTDGKANKPNGDGYIENPLDIAYSQSKAQEAADLGYKIFTIGLGNVATEINEIMLKSIAETTGAKYYHAPTGADLADIYNSISFDVCQYGSISGCLYQDVNNDSQIAGESGLSGWEIVLSGNANLTRLTDESGCYNFAGLTPGSYVVSEGNNADKGIFNQTYPSFASYDLSLNNSQDVSNIDFANYLPVCGNTILDSGETCDDGNLTNGDGCDNVCQIEEIILPAPICGNNVLETDEACDDGNLASGDGCSAVCEIEQVVPPEPSIKSGDIVINEIMQNPDRVADAYGEWFEVYNATNQDIDLQSCVISDNNDSHVISSSLIVPGLGYAVLARNGDIARNGNFNADYVYSGFILGNGADQIILTCDNTEIDRVEYDGGANWPDPTGASMILNNPNSDNNVGANWCVSVSSFGLGDLGTPGLQNDSCDGGSPALACGNSVLEANEACDDGNLTSGDGCSAVCEIEQIAPPAPICGNTILDSGEACDDGNLANGDGCDNVCQIEEIILPAPICGNNVLEIDEACDDGNLINSDGCSDVCQIEQINNNEEERGDEEDRESEYSGANQTPEPIKSIITGGNGPIGQIGASPTVNTGSVLGASAVSNVSIVKSADKDFVNAGFSLIYTISLKNIGETNLVNLVITDILPNGFTYENNSTLTFNVSLLEKGQEWQKQFEVKVDKSVAPGFYENKAIVKPENGGEKTASVVTEVKAGKVLGITTLPKTGSTPISWLDNKPILGKVGGWLKIASIGVSMPIIESSDESGLELGAWRLPETSTPDRGGNTVITAHRHKSLPPSAETFYLLDQLQKGDVFEINWRGKKYQYRTISSLVVSPSDVWVANTTQDPIVTLITCAPLWSDKERLVVRGELIGQ